MESNQLLNVNYASEKKKEINLLIIDQIYGKTFSRHKYFQASIGNCRTVSVDPLLGLSPALTVRVS